jgi:ketosteroid isomerase-like protein
MSSGDSLSAQGRGGETQQNPPRDPLLVALLFNERINSGDLDGLCALMAPDHVFIDAEGSTLRSSDRIRAAWHAFFHEYPDYRNHFQLMRCTGATVSILGCSTCSCGELEGPALWSTRIETGRVAEWRVWRDTQENRKLLGLTSSISGTPGKKPTGTLIRTAQDAAQ